MEYKGSDASCIRRASRQHPLMMLRVVIGWAFAEANALLTTRRPSTHSRDESQDNIGEKYPSGGRSEPPDGGERTPAARVPTAEEMPRQESFFYFHKTIFSIKNATSVGKKAHIIIRKTD